MVVRWWIDNEPFAQNRVCRFTVCNCFYGLCDSDRWVLASFPVGTPFDVISC